MGSSYFRRHPSRSWYYFYAKQKEDLWVAMTPVYMRYEETVNVTFVKYTINRNSGKCHQISCISFELLVGYLGLWTSSGLLHFLQSYIEFGIIASFIKLTDGFYNEELDSSYKVSNKCLFLAMSTWSIADYSTWKIFVFKLLEVIEVIPIPNWGMKMQKSSNLGSSKLVGWFSIEISLEKST